MTKNCFVGNSSCARTVFLGPLILDDHPSPSTAELQPLIDRMGVNVKSAAEAILIELLPKKMSNLRVAITGPGHAIPDQVSRTVALIERLVTAWGYAPAPMECAATLQQIASQSPPIHASATPELAEASDRIVRCFFSFFGRADVPTPQHVALRQLPGVAGTSLGQVRSEWAWAAHSTESDALFWIS